MATEINQIDDFTRSTTILRIGGDMMRADAEFVERVAKNIRSETGHEIRIDLADLDFIDSEAAPVIRRLAEREGFEIEGVEIFLQSVVDHAEGRS